MNSPIHEIKSFVAENRTGDALSRLLELSQNNKQVHDAIHIVLAEFNDLTSQRLKGTIDNSEATRRLNVIQDKILIALGAFDSGGRVLPGVSIPDRKKHSMKLLLITGLCAVVLGFIAQAMIGQMIDNGKDDDWTSLAVLSLASEWLLPFGLIVLGIWAIALFVNVVSTSKK